MTSLFIVSRVPCVMPWTTSYLSSVTPRSSSITSGAVLYPIRSLIFDLWPCVLSNCKRCHDSVFCGVPLALRYQIRYLNRTPGSLSLVLYVTFTSVLFGRFPLISLGFSSLSPLVDLLWSNSESYSHFRTSHVLQCYLFFYFLRFNWGYHHF